MGSHWTITAFSMDLIYLDYNCFQRGFDDLNQPRIQMEAIACQEILRQAEENSVNLVWSFMHLDETLLCPFNDRKHTVLGLSSLCKIRINPVDLILDSARNYQKQTRLSPKDALYLACASYVNADYFITCDDQLVKEANKLSLSIILQNPILYITNL
jgi:predicted nucleic acid-binding protein